MDKMDKIGDILKTIIEGQAGLSDDELRVVCQYGMNTVTLGEQTYYLRDIAHAIVTAEELARTRWGDTWRAEFISVKVG
jgi:hypothetical protein